MGNQTWVYAVKKDELEAHRVTGQWDSYQLRDIEFPEPVPLMDWIRREWARAANEKDKTVVFDIREFVCEYIVEHLPGMIYLTEYPKSFYFVEELDLIIPNLPEKLQERFRRIIGKGTPVSESGEIPLAILNEHQWTWSFLTREDIIEAAPIIRESLREQMPDELEEDWEGILTAHEDEEYDWVVFVYPY